MRRALTSRRGCCRMPEGARICGDNFLKKSNPRLQNLPYLVRTLLTEGRHHEASWWWSRPETGPENRSSIRRPTRETATAGAAPALPARNRQSGRLWDPTWGYYDPCARSSLDGLAPIASSRKRGPQLKNAAAERREARRPASWAGHLRRSGDGLDREAGHGCGVPHQRLSALCSPHFFGERKRTRAPGALTKKPGGGALAPVIPGPSQRVRARHGPMTGSARSPESITAGQEHETSIERQGNACGYGFRSRRLRAVPE
jgi:hypothetical protein